MYLQAHPIAARVRVPVHAPNLIGEEPQRAAHHRPYDSFRAGLGYLADHLRDGACQQRSWETRPPQITCMPRRHTGALTTTQVMAAHFDA